MFLHTVLTTFLSAEMKMKYLNFPGKVRRIVRISQKEWGTVNPLMGSKTEAFRILSYAAL